MGEKKRNKPNVSCFNCKKKYCLEELEEEGYVEKFGDFIVFDCPNCGESSYINKGKGYKSKKIN